MSVLRESLFLLSETERERGLSYSWAVNRVFSNRTSYTMLLLLLLSTTRGSSDGVPAAGSCDGKVSINVSSNV